MGIAPCLCLMSLAGQVDLEAQRSFESMEVGWWGSAGAVIPVVAHMGAGLAGGAAEHPALLRELGMGREVDGKRDERK